MVKTASLSIMCSRRRHLQLGNMNSRPEQCQIGRRLRPIQTIQTQAKNNGTERFHYRIQSMVSGVSGDTTHSCVPYFNVVLSVPYEMRGCNGVSPVTSPITNRYVYLPSVMATRSPIVIGQPAQSVFTLTILVDIEYLFSSFNNEVLFYHK